MHAKNIYQLTVSLPIYIIKRGILIFSNPEHSLKTLSPINAIEIVILQMKYFNKMQKLLI